MSRSIFFFKKKEWKTREEKRKHDRNLGSNIVYLETSYNCCNFAPTSYTIKHSQTPHMHESHRTFKLNENFCSLKSCIYLFSAVFKTFNVVAPCKIMNINFLKIFSIFKIIAIITLQFAKLNWLPIYHNLQVLAC